MPLFDGMHYDQKWSLWDTFPGFVRNITGNLIVSAHRMGNLVSAKRRGQNLISALRRRSNTTSGG